MKYIKFGIKQKKCWAKGETYWYLKIEKRIIPLSKNTNFLKNQAHLSPALYVFVVVQVKNQNLQFHNLSNYQILGGIHLINNREYAMSLQKFHNYLIDIQ
jgi:hypothetical protein